MLRRGLTIIILLIPLFVLAVMTLPAQGTGPASEPAQQTWPSRTPTPEGGPTNTPLPGVTEPPPPPGGGGGGDDDSTATPEPTSDEQPEATATGGATAIASTPIGGYLPTAEPCSMSPTIQTRGQVNVRQGPGIDYPTVGQLVYLEVRPISGRAAYTPWWLIQLASGDQGWVADQAITVQGYTGAVPLVEPPAIGGHTPTPGAPWNPTPNPICTPEPTPTPTETPMATRTTVAQPASVAVQSTPAAPTSTAVPAATVTPFPPTATSIPATVAPAVQATPIPTAAPLVAASDGGGIGSMMLYGGIGLLVIGLAAAALRLRGRPVEDS
jgi:hypothetical protein